MRTELKAAILTAGLAAAVWGGRAAAVRGAGGAPARPIPPVARKIPHAFLEHGHERVDEYYWLKEREDPEVRAYLEAENAYTDAVMAHTRALQDRLFREITGRIPEDDQTAPYRERDYEYYSRYVGTQEYAVHCRRRRSPGAPEEILLDGNELGRGLAYFSLKGPVVSPGQDRIVFATDTVGRRLYTLQFKDLGSGRLLPDTIPAVTGEVEWANDGRTVFYVKQHPETLRWYRVYRHVLGDDPANDVLAYEEADETFNVSLSKSKSRRYLMITSIHTLATEVRILDADRPRDGFSVFEPRQMGHEYRVEHAGGDFYVLTNLEARNFRLMKTPEGAPGRRSWTEVVPTSEDTLIEDFDVSRDDLVLVERRSGLIRMRTLSRSGGPGREIAFDEPAYEASLDQNREPDTTVVRYAYTSLTTPRSIYEFDMRTGRKTLLKRDEVGGGYDPGRYRTERVYARARDGMAVPLSIVYRAETPRDGTSPLLLYAYGSYGASTDASFDPEVLSLLDRGFVYAIAHVRGGQELGRQWYEDGKVMRKKNTFTDFIDCALHLVDQRYTRPDRLFAEGGSAGGLLMGAITNMRPDLFKGVIARVPFVDVITTMMDPSIPLTSEEWDEWGDPRKKADYEYMLSYSPYDNIEAKAYPNMLVTTSLHDSQVQYWEPAKYVARLRATRTDQNLLLLRTDMRAGHSGKTGRFHSYRDTAFAYAFLLDLVGISESVPVTREP
jgi:oligopeptidase B